MASSLRLFGRSLVASRGLFTGGLAIARPAAATLQPRLVFPASRRTLYAMPDFSVDLKDGIAPVHTAKTTQLLSTSLQNNLNKLNELLPSHPELEGISLYELIQRSARNQHTAPVFNHASQAFNTHFCLSCLTTKETKPSAFLLAKFAEEFESFEQFKEHFTNVAESMFGCGTVWLIEDENGELRVISTFNAGSPLAPARLQFYDDNVEEELDVGTEEAESFDRLNSILRNPPRRSRFDPMDKLPGQQGELREMAKDDLLKTLRYLTDEKPELPTSTAAPAAATNEAPTETAAGDVSPVFLAKLKELEARGGDLEEAMLDESFREGMLELSKELEDQEKRETKFPFLPILAINMWEHAYLLDHGFDKKAYIEAWWKGVDWERVESILKGVDEEEVELEEELEQREESERIDRVSL